MNFIQISFIILVMMIKTIMTFVLLFNFTTLALAADDKDWTFDPKTSTLIPNYLGKIKVLKGKAIIGDRELKKGSKIYNNDLIQTSEASFLVMEMIDLTTVTLGPKSDFKVENWKYRTKNDRDAQFTVLKGQWRALVRSKSKDPDQLKIKTPRVSLGIRGTELMVNVLNVGEKEVEQVALLDGAIHMEGETPELTRDLVPGDHAVIIKSEKGTTHEERKFTQEEAKSYQEFVEPGVLRLLDPVAIASNEVNADKNVSTNTTSENSTKTAKAPYKKEKNKSLQENLQLLNTTREENRKTK